MRVISPFKHEVHNWRIQDVLYFINFNHQGNVISTIRCFYGDYKYHYCFVRVYQSHLYGHLVLIAETADEFC